MNNIIDEIRFRLFELQDLEYRDFNAKLLPNVDKDKIIGVRSPALKKLAKEFSNRDDIELFLNDLPHKYYEENNMHCFILHSIKKDYDYLITKTEEILPYIDNWATCDSFSPPLFKKHPDKVYEKIKEWIKSKDTYTVRYGIVRLMSNFLDDEFKPEMINLVSSIKSDEYYINMAIAWYFSFALIKQYDKTIGLIESKKMDKFVHNKSIQKAIESSRIDKSIKDYLRTLKIK